MPARLRNGLALLALLALAWWVHAPGLSAGFLFDDFVNLPTLGATGPIDDWPTLWRYLTSGIADPTGRPLSMLSFLLDANDWPADPAPFLRTNLLIHLGNGALLFVLLRLLERAAGGQDAHRNPIALLGAGLWLLHPLFVSTTLYIVQREAMLPATFTLLGLIAWIHGRSQLFAGRPRGVAWMLGGVMLGTALAAASKPNGLLLPLLIWILEATVLQPRAPANPPDARLFRRLRIILLVLPSLAVIAYVASLLVLIDTPLPDRPWTIGERLLTEPRVLLDYLQLLAVPQVLSTGLYNDGYPVSTGLLHPVATLPACLLVLALLTAGFVLRRRAPAWAAALLFFFGGHLLESTTIPLELYFEHRNYLPAILVFWPLARAVYGWRIDLRVRTCVAVALLGLCALLTHQRASLWGQPARMAQLWAQQNPQSPRAQATAAAANIAGGRPDLALQRLEPLRRQRPHELQLVLGYANAACAVRGLAPEEVAAVTDAFRNASHGHNLAYAWLDGAIARANRSDCPGLDLAAIEAWLQAAAANPIMQAPGRRQDLAALRGQLALARGMPGAALKEFDRSLAAYPTPGAAARQAALLAGRGHLRLAIAHLDHYQRLAPHAVREGGWTMARVQQWVHDRQGYWPRELARLRAMIESDLARQGASAVPDAPSQHISGSRP